MCKLFFATVLAASSLLTSSQATESVGIASILDNLENLPKIFNHKLVVNYGPEFADVRPTALITFDFASCRKFTFSVEIIEAAHVNFVKIIYNNNQADCRGLPVKRTYQLQVSSDYNLGAKRFVILNPIGQDLPLYLNNQTDAAVVNA